MLTVGDKQYPLLLLSSIHKRRYRKSNAPKTHKIPCDLLCVAAQGQGTVRIDGRVFHMDPFQAFFLRPSMDIEAMLESSCAECYILLLSHVTVERVKGEWQCANSGSSRPLLPPGKLSLKHAQQLYEEVKQLHRDSRAQAGSAFELQVRFQSVLQFLCNHLSGEGETEEAGNGIDQSIGYMLKHYREKIKLTALSEIAGLTRTSYSRSFKKTKGVSPVEYLNRIRIDVSRRLLQPGCSIKEVADSVGFGNEFYFSRMFKRTVGISPTLYLRRNQLKVAVATCFRYEDNLRSLGVEALAAMNACQPPGQSDAERHGWIQEQLDTLREAGPDLILADYRHLPFSAQLKEIAPVVVLDYTMDWRKNYVRIAELVGREKEAQQHLKQVEQKVKFAQKILARRIGNDTVSFIRMYSRKIRVQGVADHPLNELLYRDLGLNPGSAVPLNERYRDFGMEGLPPFETDHLLIYPDGLPANKDEIVSSVQQNDFWLAMKAVRHNRIRTVANWIGMSWTPVGQNQIIDELLQWKA